jgi:hypothetical protein
VAPPSKEEACSNTRALSSPFTFLPGQIFLRWFVRVNLMHYMWGGMMINQFEHGR